MIIEVKLLLMEGEFDGQATVFQRLARKDHFRLISPFINDVRKEFFKHWLPFKWEPNITVFTGRKVYEITFILRQLEEDELNRVLQEKKDYIQENRIDLDPDLISLKDYEKHEILEIKKKVHERYHGPKAPNKKKFRGETSIARAFKKALANLKDK